MSVHEGKADLTVTSAEVRWPRFGHWGVRQASVSSIRRELPIRRI